MHRLARCLNTHPPVRPPLQVAGLWVVQAAAVGLGLLIIAMHLIHHRWAKPALAKSKTVKSARQLLSSASSKFGAAPAAGQATAPSA